MESVEVPAKPEWRCRAEGGDEHEQFCRIYGAYLGVYSEWNNFRLLMCWANCDLKSGAYFVKFVR